MSWVKPTRPLCLSPNNTLPKLSKLCLTFAPLASSMEPHTHTHTHTHIQTCMCMYKGIEGAYGQTWTPATIESQALESDNHTIR